MMESADWLQFIGECNFVEIDFCIVDESKMFACFQEAFVGLTGVKAIDWMKELEYLYKNLQGEREREVIIGIVNKKK
jgi:hypothetical protein